MSELRIYTYNLGHFWRQNSNVISKELDCFLRFFEFSKFRAKNDKIKKLQNHIFNVIFIFAFTRSSKSPFIISTLDTFLLLKKCKYCKLWIFALKLVNSCYVNLQIERWPEGFCGCKGLLKGLSTSEFTVTPTWKGPPVFPYFQPLW